MALNSNSPSRISNQGQSYRRGLVLGLTMAEIVILIIFILMLALAALLQLREKEIKEALAEIERLREISSLYEDDIETKEKSELIREQILTEKKFKQQEKELSDAQKEIEENKKELAEYQRETEAMAEALENAGIKSTAEDIKNALEKDEDAEALVALLKNRTPNELVEDLEEAAIDKQRLEDEIARLGRKLKGKGGDGEIGSCWLSPDDSSTEYIYDIALTDSGFIIRETNIEHREKDRINLPVSSITLNKEISGKQFRAMVTPLYNWSVERKCRFLVKIYDETGSDKILYKQQKKTVAGYFFTSTRDYYNFKK